MEQYKIAAVTEIYSALLSADIGGSADKLKTDSVGFIAENYGVDLSNIDVSVVENSGSQVHLSLPFYAGLEEASTNALADSDINEVAGGEWIVLAIIAACALAAVAIGGAVVGTQVRAGATKIEGQK